MNKKLLIFPILLIAIVAAIFLFNPSINHSIKTKVGQFFQSQPERATLEPRVLNRWNLLIKNDFTLAYQYFSPAYRKLFSLKQFLKSSGTTVKWISAKIKTVNINGERAEVTVTIRYTLDLPMGFGTDFGIISKDAKEIWLWTDNNWWHFNQNSTGAL